ncbi:cobalt-precorrin 4 C11-methyltransferase [Desulfacinum hydrothermale DSM 13146]|uniref:Cobalt-precorrin 4 C11-methyltransferase n=1 Tax=Desulfacinum hydrothermale DSM 13146 TaxID=1121390 RepID=A0A1W1WXX9_9BACT|nr:precorrin-4 C(11)-methyltransferase [Desulfacinum hydrothermale]SMC16440.1 cobalt-precorrin 4 C11-methyltransferase [Desulfacinum hydrothermale DSM 13146]
MADDPKRQDPRVFFVGAGPGDPELITVKGRRLLRRADRVVYAGSLVPRALLDECKPGAELFDSAPLTLERTHALLVEAVRENRIVVRLHTGDPALYGAIQEQMNLLDREGIAYEVVPGVSAAFAAAARIGCQLTLPEVSQTVIFTRTAGRTPVPDRESLSSLAAHGSTMAIYLSVSQMEAVVEALRGAYPEETPVVVVYRVGWPDERILQGTLAHIAAKVREAGMDRQAVILVGEALNPKRYGTRSRLYDQSFSHGFRSSRP